MAAAAPLPRLHILYGNDEVKLNDARTTLIAKFLAPEDRAGNLTEMRGPGNHPFKLEKMLPELTAELCTISLLPGLPRVVVVYNLSELYGSTNTRKPATANAAAKKKTPKGDPIQAAEDFFLGQFQESENAVLFVCEEDEDKNKAVDENCPLFRLFTRVGARQSFREKPIVRDLEDELYAANWIGAIEVLRRWRDRAGSESTVRMKQYRAVSQFVELLLQSKCLLAAQEHGRVPGDLIPASMYPSINRFPEHRRRQLQKIAKMYSFEDVRRMVESVHRVQRLMYPTGEEAYVPDWYEALEQILSERAATVVSLSET
jgi:hypothetical protein